MPFVEEVTLGAQTMGELVTAMEPLLLLAELTPPAELQEYHTAQQELAQYLVSTAEAYAPDTSLGLLVDDSTVTEQADALGDAEAAAWERLAPATRELFAGYGCGWAYNFGPVPTSTPLPRVIAAVQEYAELACVAPFAEDAPLDEIEDEIEATYEALGEVTPPPVLWYYHEVHLAGLELSLIGILLAQEQEADGEAETREHRIAMGNLLLQAKNLELAAGSVWHELDPAIQQILTGSGCVEP